jgi:hypothetical protein
MKEIDFNLLFSRIMRIAKVYQDNDLAKVLGISPQAISGAKNKKKIPRTWFQILEKEFGVTREELCRPEERVKVVAQVDIPYSHNSRLGQKLTEQSDSEFPDVYIEMDEDLPTDRRWRRETERMGIDTYREIKEWVDNMEKYRPGFSSWFRVEFQNRFPEFDDWKTREREKIAPSTNLSDVEKTLKHFGLDRTFNQLVREMKEKGDKTHEEQ